MTYGSKVVIKHSGNVATLVGAYLEGGRFWYRVEFNGAIYNFREKSITHFKG